MTNIVKLHYFPGRGRAETTRWMLAINQIKFNNIPIETPEMLLDLRDSRKLPFDQRTFTICQHVVFLPFFENTK